MSRLRPRLPQITQPIPPSTPGWLVSFVMQHGMANIFQQMRKTGQAMASGKKSPHRDLCTSKAYEPVASFLDRPVEAYLQRLGASE